MAGPEDSDIPEEDNNEESKTHAFEEGIVPGGGIALLHAREACIKSPYNNIGSHTVKSLPSVICIAIVPSTFNTSHAFFNDTNKNLTIQLILSGYSLYRSSAII